MPRCPLCQKADPPGGFYRNNPATGEALPDRQAVCRDCYEQTVRMGSRSFVLAPGAQVRIVPVQGHLPVRKYKKRKGNG